MVIDIYVRVSLVGIELLTIDARIVIASVDTYLRFAEAVNRLDLTENGPKGLPELGRTLHKGSKRRTKRAFVVTDHTAPRRDRPSALKSNACPPLKFGLVQRLTVAAGHDQHAVRMLATLAGAWGVFERGEENMPSSDELSPLGADASEYLTARSELEKALDRIAVQAEEACPKCDQLRRHSADFDRRPRRSPTSSRRSITGYPSGPLCGAIDQGSVIPRRQYRPTVANARWDS